MTTSRTGAVRERRIGGLDDRLERDERRVLELIATVSPLAAVLEALCGIIDDQSGLQSSIFLLGVSGERLQLAAGPHLPDVWRRAVASFPITETACGAAVRQGRQMISPEIAEDPLYADYRTQAAAAGFRAVWSTPIFAGEGRTVGTFAVYNRQPGPPTAANLELVARATHLASIAIERHQMDQRLRESEMRFSRAFYANPACMAITRVADGRILFDNDVFVRMFGYSREEAVGTTAASLGLYANRRQQAALWRQVATDGRLHDVDVRVRTKSGDVRDVVLSTERVEFLGEPCLLGAAVDVTERKAAEERLARSLAQARALTAGLMRAQDDERRHIAQMLHETMAQDLAALKMLLARFGRATSGLSDQDRSLLAESVELAERSMGSVRTLSYLLHPPFLDEIGLLSALRWYAKGFGERSGIDVELDLPESFDRLPQEVETALFRVVQEALINIHRHAQSRTARIHLRRDDDGLTLEINDRGQGLPPGLAARLAAGKGAVGMGVGIAGMRERLEQLSGKLDIVSSERGTTIRAVLPSPYDAR